MSMQQHKDDSFRFEGFENPTTTPVPDVLFDRLLTCVSDAELRVLLYIVRRTFGFKKSADDISLKQMVEGIKKRDGEALDHGAGLSKAGATKGLKGLVEKGIIVSRHNSSPEKGNLPTTYALRFKGNSAPGTEEGAVSTEKTPLVHQEDKGLSTKETSLVHQEDTQQTVRQQTVRQQSTDRQLDLSTDSSYRSGSEERSRVEEGPETTYGEFSSLKSLLAKRRRSAPSDEDVRLGLTRDIEDLARQFNDQAELSKSVSRAVNLYKRSGRSVDAFIYEMRKAAGLTQEYSHSIKSMAPDDGKSFRGPKKNRMAYFFSVLEDRLGLKEPSGNNRQLA